MRFILICVLLHISFNCFSQGEANNWYFGNNAGITFNTNPPSALTNGALNTNEGCSSISRPNGDLLFYTDGRTVWNRNHQPMNNANYSPATNFDGLNGDPSSTSSGLIVPHPTEDNLYFVFTLDEPHHNNAYAYPDQGPADVDGNDLNFYQDVTNHQVPTDDDGFNNGLNYSIVDMNLNGGLGDVIPDQKNIELVTYDPTNPEHLKYKASEKITAVRASDCVSIWIIVHFIDSFYAFQIDEDGIDEDPVISTAGPSITTDNYRRAALGYMKASPDGKRIISANNTTNYTPPFSGDAGDGNVYLFDFDNQTGIVSNAELLLDQINAYGVEFSSNNEKAYALVQNQQVWQWDLTSNDIEASGTNVINTGRFTGSMQLGPDGRIYMAIASSNFLGVIENPEAEAENINYNPQGLNLNGRTANLGLPPFIQSLFLNKIDIINQGEIFSAEVELCENEIFTLSYDSIPGATYTWELEGEVIENQNSPTLDVTLPNNVSLPFTEFYSLEVNLNDGSCPLIGTARINYTEVPVYQDASLTECVEEGASVSNFNLEDAIPEIISTSSLNSNQLDFNFYLDFETASTETGEITNFNNYPSTENFQTIIARISNGECVDFKQITLISGLLPELGEDSFQYYCEENFPNTVQLDTGLPQNELVNYSYLWSPTNETTPTIEVNTAGIYTVSVTNLETGCNITRSHEIENSNIANFSFEIEDTTQENNTINIIVSPESLGDYEYAIEYPFDFQDDPFFEDLAPGFYDVFVRDKNGCGIKKDRVGLLGVRDFFTPNNDGIHDYWQLEGIVKANFRVEYIRVFDRYGKLITSFDQNSKGWDGTYNGEQMPANDYWYTIKIEDEILLKGHFTLKR